LIRAPAPADLVPRARRGDRAAARDLYESHVGAVYGYCVAFTRGDREAAEDLCQDTFVAAFSSLESLEDPARFAGWLKTITRRTCLRQAERRRSERRAVLRLAREPAPASHDGGRAARVVAEVIAACPDPTLRRPAELFYGDPPLQTGEIGARLGISRTAVTTRLHRFRGWARRRMITRLAEALEDPQ